MSLGHIKGSLGTPVPLGGYQEVLLLSPCPKPRVILFWNWSIG